ncbi:MAG: (2Fe-2S)-binding protein [Gammaproteobacteria bacterium]|nr:(2Fe-2S)-binding protein [Gammaproteobacteria bacterium]
MYVCVCNKVTDHQIREAAERGLETFDELCSQLRVATCCGRCRDCAHRVLDEARAERWSQDVALAYA